jgi:hypothetical protein
MPPARSRSAKQCRRAPTSTRKAIAAFDRDFERQLQDPVLAAIELREQGRAGERSG